MQIWLEELGKDHYLRVVGDVDCSEVHLLRQELDKARMSARTRLIIDLSGVEFLTGIGFSLLKSAVRDIRSKGVVVTLVQSSFTGHMFGKLGIDLSANTAPSSASALWEIEPTRTLAQTA
jgi:anti-anti-sigma factor